ncbi:MAG TPA: ATP-binding protein [Deltaproteobacteria bacterium]|nr:ATP-binding protein [Deltaproteobacteria bacterium]
MAKKKTSEVSLEDLRWSLDPGTLAFETTEDLKPLKGIIGQKRGVDALQFGMGMDRPGYNIFVTGQPRSGRMAAVKKVLKETSQKKKVPNDLCYVNNFKNPEVPILLSQRPGLGKELRKDVHGLVNTLKTEVPRLFESPDYISRKKGIMETYEKKTRNFFTGLEKKVKEAGFALVNLQSDQQIRPELMPIVDGKPIPILELEQKVDKGRFPRKEFEEIRKKYDELRQEVDQIFLEVRGLQKEVEEKGRKIDRLMFKDLVSKQIGSFAEKYKDKSVQQYLQAMIEDMSENLHFFLTQDQQRKPGMSMFPAGDPFASYEVNLLTDNSGQKGPPVIIESYPTYRNLFGSIERIVDRSGIWRTDFSKIKAGSFIKASGGYLVFNLMDAIMEPGVWPALKRALKTKKMEIQTYDPFYLFTTSGLKPEPIEMDTKVILLAEPYLYQLLHAYDHDLKEIFKVRADFETSMDKTDDTISKFAEFIRMKTEDEKLRPFDKTAVAALIEESVRMSGWQEKISTSFPQIADLIREADYWAAQDGQAKIQDKHVDKAIETRVYRSNMIEGRLQEMIDRGTLMIDVDGEVAGQVNGLAVYNLGDYMFGKPSRITASTSMGREGIINIEREADMSGNIHNKGVLVLSGYMRKKYAQNKPLSVSASIAFEQSYSGVEGDSASSTEIYALLSSLSSVPIRQYIAVTGSVNQNGEVQAIGGVNQKIEGFYHCCLATKLTGKQGVIIPESNVKDLMLRKDVLRAVKEGKFHIYAVRTIDEGIEILTGKKAGARKADGTYPRGTINALVDAKLKELAEGLKAFSNEDKKGRTTRSKKKD